MDNINDFSAQEAELNKTDVSAIARICQQANFQDREVIMAPLALMILGKGSNRPIPRIVESIRCNPELLQAWAQLCRELLKAADRTPQLKDALDGMLRFARSSIATGTNMGIFTEGGMN